MIEYYAGIKLLHVSCVAASGTLFALRGVLVLRGQALGNHPALRWLSYAIDTTLLAAALLLMQILRIHPGSQRWLDVKLLLVVVYIVLGSLALRRARTPRLRLGCFVAALLVFLFIVGIAVLHDPLGVLSLRVL
jgi:uncharacterized membrane protein SirB2